MEKLVEVLQDHFKAFADKRKSTRAIVFSQYRDSVEEVVKLLKPHRLFKPAEFVGQSKTSDGRMGMDQETQQNVISEFRNGTYNILVCTCIGEEGLDIGEVDLIVNVDSLSSSIRTTQRAGRTGRKRDGRVVYLISEGAEKSRYEAVSFTMADCIRKILVAPWLCLAFDEGQIFASPPVPPPCLF